MRDVDWIDELIQDDPQRFAPTTPEYDGTRDVAQRLLGCWSAHGGARDWWVNYPRAPGFTACCLGNGARGLHYAWENIVSHANGELRVHLLLNRASSWADVDSYLPYEGRVDIKMKEDLRLWVRAPEWAAESDVVCKIAGKDKDLTWRGRYASPGEVGEDQTATFHFPIAVKEVKTQIEDID